MSRRKLPFKVDLSIQTDTNHDGLFMNQVEIEISDGVLFIYESFGSEDDNSERSLDENEDEEDHWSMDDDAEGAAHNIQAVASSSSLPKHQMPDTPRKDVPSPLSSQQNDENSPLLKEALISEALRAYNVLKCAPPANLTLSPPSSSAIASPHSNVTTLDEPCSPPPPPPLPNDSKGKELHISITPRSSSVEPPRSPFRLSSLQITIPEDIASSLSFDTVKRRFKLSAQDEIHVSPCQCALNLMGMHSFFSGNNLCNIVDDERSVPGLPFQLKNSSSYGNRMTESGLSTGRGDESVTRTNTLKEQSMKIDYHEVTLLRCSTSEVHDNEGLYEPWVAFTIVCRSHDEIDSLISLLKKASNGKVVPFSFGNKVSRVEPLHKRKSSIGQLTTQASSMINSESRWTFNNNDYCEICKVNFTLLTRRHHCRHCLRSVCGDCSCVMFIQGGKYIRYCQRCYQTSLIQRHKSSKRGGQLSFKGDIYLTGKVHSKCVSLGVGTFGKLPHWKHWFASKSHRPAIGRLSLELIEAVALPSVDEVTGKSDPYVKASITGYAYTRELFLQEWLREHRYTLSSSFCSNTLSPIWRGGGIKGGEMLTLPVISTDGAILRLEVLHYDVMSGGGESSSKDKVIGLVEIPLSDFPNANSRDHSHIEYDGYIDRWYHIQPYDSAYKSKPGIIPLAKPIKDPRKSPLHSSYRKRQPRSSLAQTVESIDEIAIRTSGLIRAPIAWAMSAMNIDIYPWFSPKVHETRSKAAIHVRIKLNVSRSGDLMCHCWQPPILQRYKPPFDPQLTLNHLRRVSKKLQPYQQRIKFCEDVIKWRKPAYTCLKAYAIFAVHLYLIKYVVVLFHLYALVVLSWRLIKMKRQEVIFVQDRLKNGSIDDSLGIDSTHECNQQPNNTKSKSLLLSPSKTTIATATPLPENTDKKDSAHILAAVRWLVKIIGNNRGLETIQFKLGMVARDITILNSLWDGSNVARMEATLLFLSFSLVMHLLVSKTKLWLVGSFMFFFGTSPFFLTVVLGFGRGCSTLLRRQHLHNLELVSSGGNELKKTL